MKPKLTASSYLSISRLIIAPVVLVLILSNYYIPALILFIIAAFTDIIDSYLAEKPTKLGSALDPLADKILIGLTIIALAVKFSFPLWALIIFLLRDIILIAAGIFVYDNIKKFKPSPIGKTNTFFQIFAVIAYIINFRFKNLILLIAVILTIVSFIQYTCITFKTKTPEKEVNQ